MDLCLRFLYLMGFFSTRSGQLYNSRVDCQSCGIGDKNYKKCKNDGSVTSSLQDIDHTGYILVFSRLTMTGLIKSWSWDPESRSNQNYINPPGSQKHSFVTTKVLATHHRDFIHQLRVLLVFIAFNIMFAS